MLSTALAEPHHPHPGGGRRRRRRLGKDDVEPTRAREVAVAEHGSNNLLAEGRRDISVSGGRRRRRARACRRTHLPLRDGRVDERSRPSGRVHKPRAVPLVRPNGQSRRRRGRPPLVCGAVWDVNRALVTQDSAPEGDGLMVRPSLRAGHWPGTTPGRPLRPRRDQAPRQVVL